MKYLLDTNIVISFFKRKFDIHNKIKTAGIENCFISEITLAELLFGAEYSTNPTKHHQEIREFISLISVLPISSCLENYAKEKSRLRKAGTPVDEFDLLIGITAVTFEMTMITNNTKHFERIKNILLADWSITNP